GDGQGVLLVAHEGPGLLDDHVLVGDDVVEHRVPAHGDVLHQNAVFHLGPPGDGYATEEDAVLHGALDGAPVGHKAVDAGAVGVDVGGGVVALLGENGPLGLEHLPADGGVQQL